MEQTSAYLIALDDADLRSDIDKRLARGAQQADLVK